MTHDAEGDKDRRLRKRLKPRPGAKRNAKRVDPAGATPATGSGRKAAARGTGARRRGETPVLPDGISKLGEITTRARESLWIDPEGNALALGSTPPLIDHQHKLLLYWSPKSACTSVYVWFSALNGFAEEVRTFHAWPHMHRNMIYNRSAFFRHGLAIEPAALTAVKVLRDPYSRTVSIYRHALKTKFAEADLDRFFGGSVTSDQGFTMHQFLDLVEGLDFATCNIHYRPQTSPLELVRKPDHVINISKQELISELNMLVASLGFEHVSPDALSWWEPIENDRKVKSQAVEGATLDHTPFNRSAARNEAPFPTYDQLLTDSVRERIRRIYAIDFEAYGDYL